jgi:uncharacterized protein
LTFKPQDIPLASQEEVILSVEEAEALRLAHAERLYQEGAALRMGISRQTFGRLLDAAHQKVTRALCNGLTLRIAGGTYHLQSDSACPRCRGLRPLPSSPKETPMQIAIPTMDGQTLSQHFGHSKAFLILEVEQGTIRSQHLRENDQANGAHQHGHGQDSNHEHGHGHHDHNRFATLLKDCQVVLVGGIGAPARKALESAGLKVIQVKGTLNAVEAALLFSRGELVPSAAQDCGHHA